MRAEGEGREDLERLRDPDLAVTLEVGRRTVRLGERGVPKRRGEFIEVDMRRGRGGWGGDLL